MINANKMCSLVNNKSDNKKKEEEALKKNNFGIKNIDVSSIKEKFDEDILSSFKELNEALKSPVVIKKKLSYDIASEKRDLMTTNKEIPKFESKKQLITYESKIATAPEKKNGACCFAFLFG